MERKLLPGNSYSTNWPLMAWAKVSPSAKVERLPTIDSDSAYWVTIQDSPTADCQPPETDFYIYRQFTQLRGAKQFLMIKRP